MTTSSSTPLANRTHVELCNPVIVGTGSDLPEIVVTNDDIENHSTDFDRERAGTSLHEWTMRRTGVASRHWLPPGEGTSDMGLRAARRALESAGMEPEEIDLIVFSTVTSDYRLPGSGPLMASQLGCSAKVFQLEAACAGFVDSIITARSLMTTMGYQTALVVAAEAMSTVLDKQRFMHQTIFGDGAGAVVLRSMPGSPYGVKAAAAHTEARHCDWTFAPYGGTKMPITHQILEDRTHYLRLDNAHIFDFAVDKMVEVTHEVLAMAGDTLDDVSLVIPHQTGMNIIRAVGEQLKLDEDRMFVCIDHTGNTSGASIPIALDEAARSGTLKDGDRVVLTAVGAGMAWGGAYLVWQGDAGVR